MKNKDEIIKILKYLQLKYSNDLPMKWKLGRVIEQIQTETVE